MNVFNLTSVDWHDGWHSYIAIGAGVLITIVAWIAFGLIALAWQGLKEYIGFN